MLGIFAYGQIDLQRKMLFQLGDYNFQKYTAILGAIVQLCLNFFFIIIMGLGLKGAAVSYSLTNAIVYVCNERYLQVYHKMHTNNKMLSMFSKPFNQLKMNAYMDCAIPTVLQSFVSHASFLFISFFMGQMAYRTDVTTINIFHFFQMLLHQIAIGL